jgi:acyl carrier protein
MTADIQTVSRRVAQLIIERLELEQFTPDTLPYDAILFAGPEVGGLDLDSIASLEIVSALADEYGLDFDDVDREHFMTVNSLSAYIVGELERK